MAKTRVKRLSGPLADVLEALEREYDEPAIILHLNKLRYKPRWPPFRF